MICPECGKELEEGEGHYVSLDIHSEGFWTCDKFYGPDGRRIDTSDDPLAGIGAVFGLSMLSSLLSGKK
jgi:hypothetical protein